MKAEDKIQQEIYMWFNNTYCGKDAEKRCYIFSVPNGGTRNTREAMRLVSTGMRAGVSDLIILLPNRCIFVEVKTATGVQSKKQKEFAKIVKALGFEYLLVRSLADAKAHLNLYLKELNV